MNDPKAVEAERRVQEALVKIENAQNLLASAQAELSAIIGAAPKWSKLGKLHDRVKAFWYELHGTDRRRWQLDHEPTGDGS